MKDTQGPHCQPPGDKTTRLWFMSSQQEGGHTWSLALESQAYRRGWPCQESQGLTWCSVKLARRPPSQLVTLSLVTVQRDRPDRQDPADSRLQARPCLQALVWGCTLSFSPAATWASPAFVFPWLRAGFHRWDWRHLKSVNPIVQSWASDVSLSDTPVLRVQASYSELRATNASCSPSPRKALSTVWGTAPSLDSGGLSAANGRGCLGPPWLPWWLKRLDSKAATNSTDCFHFWSPFHIHKNVPLLFPIHKEIPYAYSFNVKLMD